MRVSRWTEYSTRKSGLVGAILKMHRFETYRRTERISYPPFTCHFSFQSITGINLHSRLGGEDLHLTPACWIIHPGSPDFLVLYSVRERSFVVIRFISLNNWCIRQLADVPISGAIYAHTVIGILVNWHVSKFFFHFDVTFPYLYVSYWWTWNKIDLK